MHTPDSHREEKKLLQEETSESKLWEGIHLPRLGEARKKKRRKKGGKKQEWKKRGGEKGKEKWKLGKTNHKGIGKEMRKENNDGGKY